MAKDPISARGRARLQDQLGDRFLDLLIEHGLSPEDWAEDMAGRAVHIPQVNFDVPLEQKVRAKMGPPPYAVRAKYIEDLTEALHADLEAQWHKLAEALRDDPARFTAVWESVVGAIDLAELNKLINEHNTFYPIEANLQADPDTGKIMIGATEWKPKKKLSAEALLKKFPAELAAALKK